MSRNLPGIACPSCHGTNLADGRLGVNRHTFVPAGRWMFLGYGVRGFVCLDCGFLGQYLERQDVDDIRRKQT
jgi:hypothetical protein